MRGASRWHPRAGTEPTQRNLEVLAASMLYGIKGAAAQLGIGVSQVKVHITDICDRLEVETRWEAAIACGWLRIPSDYMRASHPGGTMPQQAREERSEG